MNFFKEVNLDWMGKAKYFVALSLTLLLIGGASWMKKGGLRYGIDFKGGTLVYVRFAQPPNIDKIRAGLAAQGLGDSTIQQIRDLANPNSNEVVIGLEQHGSGDQALDVGKAAILAALHQTFGTAESGEADFNSVGTSALAGYLTSRDPLALGLTAGDRYAQLARRLTDFRDKSRNGIVTRFEDLKGVEGANDTVVAALRGGYTLGNFTVRNVEIVGPKVGAQLRRQAILVTLYALAGMLVYIAVRFELVYGAAAVLAVFHDGLITL